MFYLSLFAKFVKVRFKAKLEYPLPYLMGIVAQWVGYGANYAAMWLMVNTFGTMAAWQPMEVLFLEGLNTLCYALAGTVMLDVSNWLPDAARTGQFDDVLLKPVDSLLYAISANINVSYVSHILLSIAVMVFSGVALGIELTASKLIWLGVTILSGAVIHASAMILTAAPSLVLLGTKGFQVLYWNVEDFIHYPISIYGRPLQIILTFVLPYAFIVFYPSQPFLGKMDTMLFPAWFQYLSPAVAVVMLLAAIWVWHVCANKYESSGS